MILSRYEGQLNILQRFYERMARYGIKNGVLMLLLDVAQSAIPYIYLIKACIGGKIPVGTFTVLLRMFERQASAFVDIKPEDK